MDFSAILPPQIISDYQSQICQISGIEVRIMGGTLKRTLKLKLKGDKELR